MIRNLTMEDINKNEKAEYNKILNRLEPAIMCIFENFIKICICKSYLYLKHKI